MEELGGGPPAVEEELGGKPGCPAGAGVEEELGGVSVCPAEARVEEELGGKPPADEFEEELGGGLTWSA